MELCAADLHGFIFYVFFVSCNIFMFYMSRENSCIDLTEDRNGCIKIKQSITCTRIVTDILTLFDINKALSGKLEAHLGPISWSRRTQFISLHKFSMLIWKSNHNCTFNSFPKLLWRRSLRISITWKKAIIVSDATKQQNKFEMISSRGKKRNLKYHFGGFDLCFCTEYLFMFVCVLHAVRV